MSTSQVPPRKPVPVRTSVSASPNPEFAGHPAAAKRRLFGRSRRTLLIIGIGVVLCVLAIVIGLAVGLTTKSKGKNLPLPDGAQTFTGELTYYAPGLGACGKTSGDSDAIVSISHFTFDAVQKGGNPNQNPLCGRKIRAQRKNGGKQVSVDLTVVDRCMNTLRTGCAPTDIDVSPAMFKKLANPDLGRVTVAWAWL
ncbi:RlpA-like double-psi beta-barrel-protein domain-containing protein-containing protein [Massariosphaeria phaeospora]|uniref:RlpA-like double-psi beta-barrel-protein domain-containing protein-containing protein n=1 Tax=Massariosphaeria phaeospora TaxID=100035 RepID=A0A7C8IIW4_9PLEO|nr:RlpA-like double-psi beta-barrel-protein domain-containing protein-containing protein [Massariosphaeria phaeospora]